MKTAPPDELSRLGPPVQSHETIIGPPVYTSVCKLLLGVAGVLMVGMAGLCVVFLINPFGAKPPPPGVALGCAVGSAALGVLMLTGSVAYDAICLRARAIPSAYLIYRDALVVMLSNRPTVLRWDDIRAWTGRRTLTARDGRTIHVDPYVKGRERLVARIEDELKQRLLPPVWETIAAGGAATFGPLAISSAGLAYGGEVIPWGAVGSISVQGLIDRRLVVRPSDEDASGGFCMALPGVANDFLLPEVIGRFLPPGAPLVEETPLTRAYRHPDCGGLTVVSGDDYVLMECPFRPVSSTFCCGCRKFVPLSAVVWADTGEVVAKYRKRLAALVPARFHNWMGTFADAYQGAVNLRLEKKGQPPGWPREPWA